MEKKEQENAVSEANAPETMVLKWGLFKSANFKDSPEAAKTLNEIGFCEDPEKEKELTCKMIDQWNGDIYVWWDQKIVSKEEAKKYVMEYDSNPKSF